MSLHQEAQDGILTRPLLQKYLSKDPDALKTEDWHGYTPLALAVREGHVGVVKLLLQNKADANQKIRDGRTPLYIAMSAKQNTKRIAQLLLTYDANVNFPIKELGNETAIMAAIVQSRDPEVIQLIVDNGASLTRANDKGETAKSLADQSANPAIHRALLSEDKKGGWQTELESLLVSSGLFARAYFSNSKEAIENAARRVSNFIGSEEAGKAQGIDDPQTEDEFQKDLYYFIEKQGLEDFYPRGSNFVAQVAQNAVQMVNSPRSLPLPRSSIRTLAQLALYKPVFYCDDSGSMKEENRWENLKSVVKAMTDIMTSLPPDLERTVQLRFINKDDSTADLSPSEVLNKLNFTPDKGTMIGTSLKDKVLKPFIYDVINGGDVLARPYLIITITDGCPTGEDIGTFRSVVYEFKNYILSKGYSTQAVRFNLNQIGSDDKAKEFLDSFVGDSLTNDILYVTADRIDAVFREFQDNKQVLYEWLENRLVSSVSMP
jgi:hypothetical protein